MRAFRRATQRVAPALASVASVLLFATCDFDKISGTPKPLTPADLAKVFTISSDTLVTLGATMPLQVNPGAGVSLAGTATRWSSSNANATVDSLTGVVTGVTIGGSVITARLLSPELDTGYAQTRNVRVRYKGVVVSAIDSIAGKNLSRAITVRGTNNSDAPQATALTAPGLTLSVHDSVAAGAPTTTNVATITGTNVFGRSNGIAYVVGLFDNLRDSVKVKVRQVAKTLVLPVTYTATALNMNRPRIGFTMTDAGDSVMTTSPVMRFRSSDTTVFTIDSLTGVHLVKKLGTATMTVRVDTIQKTTTLVVDQAPGIVQKTAGDAQTDTIGRLLPLALQVTVRDSGNTLIQGDSVTFRVTAGGGTITDSVKLTDVNGRATLGSWRLGLAAGPQTVTAASGTISAVFSATARPMRAFGVDFQTDPKGVGVGAVMQPVVVVIRDSLNNIVSATDSVSLALTNNPGGATLGGTKKRAAVAGVATFNDLTVSTPGAGYTMTASSGLLSTSLSDAFDVYGTPAKLAVTRQPVGTSAGATLDTISFAVQDASNALVANGTQSVSIAILNNPGAATLSGTTTVNAVNGIATFTGLTINNAGVGYTLRATSTGLTASTTSSFDIAAVGTAAKLAFTTQPGNVASGATPTLAVTIQDANGATVATSNATVTIGLVAGTNTGTLAGTLVRNAVNGVATFPGISVNKAGTGYRISAAATGLTGAQSSAFNVTPGTATKLGFIQNPTHNNAGFTMTPSVTVGVLDAGDNVVTGVGPTAVSLAIGGCAATPSGTGPVNTVNGIATFGGFQINSTATNCSLNASATGLAVGTSNNFNVVAAGTAVRLGFGIQPVNATAGVNMTGVQIQLRDAAANAVTTPNVGVTLSVLSGPGAIVANSSGTTSGGVLTLTPRINVAGTYKLLVSATGYKTDSSFSFVINPGVASGTRWATEPSSIAAGVPFSPPVSVRAVDDFGNTATSFNGTLQVGFNNDPTGQASLSGSPTQLTAVNGVATFNGLTIKKAGAGFILFNNSPGQFGGPVSSAFNVTAGSATTLGFTTQPQSTTAGNTFSATVQVQDSVGNAIASFASPITVALTGGDPSGVLTGTKTISPTSGSSAFTGLGVTKAATQYKLSASASGLTTASSNDFEIQAASPTKLGWIDQPQNTFANAPLNPSGQLPRVAVQDQFGNTSNQCCFTMKVRIGTAPGGVVQKFNGNNQIEVFIDLNEANGTLNRGVGTLPTSLTLSGAAPAGMTMIAEPAFGAALTSATSNSFTLAAHSTKTKLGFAQAPQTSNGYAVGMTPSVSVAIQDQYGNTVLNATDPVTISLAANPGAATLAGGGTKSAVAGLATYPELNLDKEASGYTLEATATGLTSVTTGLFNITTPGTIVQNASSLFDMVFSTDTVYWIQHQASGSLQKVSRYGGTVTPLVVTTEARKVAADAANVYWIERGVDANSGAVKRLRKSDNDVLTLTAAAEVPSFVGNGFSVDATHVYYVARNNATNGYAIRRVPITGGASEELFDVTFFGNPYFLLDAANSLIYYYDPNLNAMRRMTTSGASKQTLVAGQGAYLFAQNGTTLYIADFSNNVRSLSTTTIGGSVTPHLTHANFVRALAVNGTNAYVDVEGVIRRYPLASFISASAQQIATNAWMEAQMLFDSISLYYFTGNLEKVAK